MLQALKILVLILVIIAAYFYNSIEPTNLQEPAISIQLSAPTLAPSTVFDQAGAPEPAIGPYNEFFIDSLKDRTYGGGAIEEQCEMDDPEGCERFLFKYMSEGLLMYGFINIPEGEGPFPVVVMLHGRVEKSIYTTLGYTGRYADHLSQNGYIVINPNLRGYEPSEDGENRLGIGDTVDVLNLIALVRDQAGTPGLLEKADAGKIGLWGHSMGGGIIFRTLVVDKDIDAAVLYSSIHPIEEYNLANFNEDGRGRDKLPASTEELQMISPYYYMDEITTPVSVHYGNADIRTPPAWSEFICEEFEKRGKDVECLVYPDQPHTFWGEEDVVFMENTLRFFDSKFR